MDITIFRDILLADDGWFDEAQSDMKLVPIALAEDGWVDRREHLPEAAMRPGDLVLYRGERGALVPAVLTEAAGNGCWLARDSRHLHGPICLAAGSIVTRLPRPDSLEEAA